MGLFCLMGLVNRNTSFIILLIYNEGNENRKEVDGLKKVEKLGEGNE